MSSKFSSLKLPKPFLDNIASLGFESMTPIQAQSLPVILTDKDVIAQAKTGSGKTVAFGVGLLWNIKTSSKNPSSLVLCPTRELAEQISVELRKLARRTPNLKILNLTGGIPIGPQIRSLEHGAHVIIGTPGRVQDHIRKGSLSLSSVNKLVLDEADRMLDMGFLDDIKNIVSHCPESKQTLLFSATYPESIGEVSEQFQNDPIHIKIDTKHETSKISQTFYSCSHEDKLKTLKALLYKHQIHKAVAFCQTKADCDILAHDLSKNDIVARAIHGDMEQREREEVLTLFANGSLNVLVATDVAARGIDIKDLPAVINYELSKDPQVHTHRIGRTGRAGSKGLAISLVSPREERRFKLIQEANPHLKLERGETIKSQFNYLPKPEMLTLTILAGKRNKLRPGDILGALTQGASIQSKDVGKINIFPVRSYVAVRRSLANKALHGLRKAKIKNRDLKLFIVN